MIIFSAGGGRTGTLLALLILIEQLKRQGNVNIPRTVKLLREARTGMVANLVKIASTFLLRLV